MVRCECLEQEETARTYTRRERVSTSVSVSTGGLGVSNRGLGVSTAHRPEVVWLGGGTIGAVWLGGGVVGNRSVDGADNGFYIFASPSHGRARSPAAGILVTSYQEQHIMDFTPLTSKQRAHFSEHGLPDRKETPLTTTCANGW